MSKEINRILFLENRAAIENLINHYAQYVRNNNSSACAALFTQDATFEVRDASFCSGANTSVQTRSKLTGPSEISGHLNKTAVMGVRLCPMIHNICIQVDGNVAVANSVMMTSVLPYGHQILGEYEDSFRYDGKWYFSSRIFTILGEIKASAQDKES